MPVCSAITAAVMSRMRMRSSARAFTDSALPPMEPMSGSWIMTRLWGSMSRRSPATNSNAAMLAAVPMHTVRTGQEMARMTS